MTNFEAAVELSLNNWVASFPTEFEIPEPTEAYKKNIAKLIDKMRGDRYHRFTRNTARAILIAAIIMAIATVSFATTVGREFIVEKFKYYSTYHVVDKSGVKEVDDITVGYIPEGFESTYRGITETGIGNMYESSDGWIVINKVKLYSQFTIETEHKNVENIMINGIEGVYYENPDSEFSGVIWNNSEYVYTVEGNISEEELIKIAESIT